MTNLPFPIKKAFSSLYARASAPIGWLIPLPKIEILKGEGSTVKLAKVFKTQGTKRPIVITDSGIAGLGLQQPLVDALQAEGMDVALFSDVHPDPGFTIINRGVEACKEHDFDAIIAIGGGSSMDSAKIINICATFDKDPHSLVGMFKTRKKGKLFACIPTTAGTGSEVTFAAIITDEKSQLKRLIIDPCLLPSYAVLDPELLRGLPPSIVAPTGMDALTHAIEAYLSLGATKATNKNALEAIGLIFKNLPRAVHNPEDMEAKGQMLIASHLAGLAFTKANVGWVHALAHQLGGLYHTPHGLANAILLPGILEFYRDTAEVKLAAIAHAAGLATPQDSDSEAAQKLIQGIIALNQDLNIPEKLNDLKEEDIPKIAERATTETFKTPYPVPKYFDSMNELEDFLRGMLP